MRSGNPNPSPENRFQKGVSGNPGGRPKSTLGNDLRTLLEEEAKLAGKQAGHGISNREAFLRNLFDHVMRTWEPSLVRLLFNYHDGAPPDAPPADQDEQKGGKVLKVPGSRRRRDRDGDGDA